MKCECHLGCNNDVPYPTVTGLVCDMCFAGECDRAKSFTWRFMWTALAFFGLALVAAVWVLLRLGNV